MRDLINKLELLENVDTSKPDIVKISNGISMDDDHPIVHFVYDLIEEGYPEEDIVNNGSIFEVDFFGIFSVLNINSQGDLERRYIDPLRMHLITKPDIGSSIKTVPEIRVQIENLVRKALIQAGFGTDIANQTKFDIGGPWKNSMLISTPEYLKAINDAYQWRRINVEDL